MRQINFDDRQLLVFSPDEAVESAGHHKGRFVLLLEGLPIGAALTAAIVADAVQHGCTEICTVGHEAERLHDDIDALLEAQGHFDVVTTWHANENAEEGCWYFLFVAGGQPPLLLAIVDDPAVVELLERAVAS